MILSSDFGNEVMWSEGQFIMGRGYGKVNQHFLKTYTGLKSFQGHLGISGYECEYGVLSL